MNQYGFKVFFYTPELDRNVLSMDQLMLQGYTVKVNGEKCQIYPMFSTPISNIKNDVTGLTKDEEIGERGRRIVINDSSVHEGYKADYLNAYFENLNMSSMEPDWNIMIIRAIEFHDFSNCKSLLDMLEDAEYALKYKHELETKFEEMVKWFLINSLGINTRSVHP
ncbi:hypothetical protein Hanom_Chr06g00482961 [Helianthus anomalus]